MSASNSEVSEGRILISNYRPWALEDVEKHVTQQLTTETVTAVTGEEVHLPVRDYPITLCCHSDSPGALEIVRTAKKAIDRFNQEHNR